jgi:hypothetical protein
MDISIEAIEAELGVAQANAGRPLEAAALARAQIIATLLAGGLGKPEPELHTWVDGQTGEQYTSALGPANEPDQEDDFFAEERKAKKK